MRGSVLTLAAAALLTTACGRPGQVEITVTGSTEMQPIAEKWAEAYHAGHPGVVIHVKGADCAAGLKAAQQGAPQLGMCSRWLEADEERGLQAWPMAHEGLALIVHKSSRIHGMSVADARNIYAGKLTNWKDLGAGDGPITVVARAEGSRPRRTFEEILMKGGKTTASAVAQDSAAAVRQKVASDPAAIGYVSIDEVDGSVQAIRIGADEPDEIALNAGKYRVGRPYYFLVKDDPKGAVADFFAWMIGPEGAAISRKEGLMPLKSLNAR